MAHRVPKCKIDTAWKALVAMLWRDKCSTNVNDSLDFFFRAFTCIVGAILYAGESLGYCSSGTMHFCMYVWEMYLLCACMYDCIYVCKYTQKPQINLGHRPTGAIHFRLLRQGLSPGLDGGVRRGVRPAPEVLPVCYQCWNYRHAPLWPVFYVSKCVAATFFLSLLVFI